MRCVRLRCGVRMSQDAFDTLMTLAIEDAQRKEELRVNRTYVTAARILMELIDAKRQGPNWSPTSCVTQLRRRVRPGSSPRAAHPRTVFDQINVDVIETKWQREAESPSVIGRSRGMSAAGES